MQNYSKRYGWWIVERFIKTRGRGYNLILNIWPRLNANQAVEFFCSDQLKWNIYKKLVKLADRLLEGGLSEEVVQVNCLTSVEYFKKIAEKELGDWIIRRDLS